MEIKKVSILITLFLSGVFLTGCSQGNSIKRSVYFNFSLGASHTETNKQWEIFKNKNNGHFFTKHNAADDITYYSSIDVRSNKYDTIVNFISVFYFLEPSQYSEMVDANNMNSTSWLDGESKNQVESISSDIVNDLKTKYGNPTDTINTSDLDFDAIKIKKYSWGNKNDLDIQFIKKTMYVMDGDKPKYSFSFRIIYEYTDAIKKKYFEKKSPY